jgi:probable F420-dependent oxidoreductase
MLFGIGIPTCREGLAYPSGFANLQQIAHLAREAEQLGFDALWGNDHLATQHVVMETQADPPNFYEPLITFAYLAGQTTRLKFIAATLVTPLREPVLLAKQVATLDQASNGRFLLGLGIGAYREEFEAIANPPPKANRGRMMMETVTALRLLFNQRRASYSGSYYQFAEIELFPKPVQQPLPIYLSGNAPDAIRRAAQIGNGWILASASVDRTRESLDVMRAAVAEAGRTREEVEACVQVWVAIGETEQSARATLERSQHFRRLRALKPDADADDLARLFAEQNLFGTPQQISARIAAYRDIGVDHLGLIFLADDINDLFSTVRLFSQEVLPLFHYEPQCH